MARIKYIGHQQELDHLSGSYPLTWAEMIDNSLTNKEIKYVFDKWKLTKRQKECMTHYYLNKLTLRQIADILGISHATVYQHIRYAKKKAKTYLPNGHK